MTFLLGKRRRLAGLRGLLAAAVCLLGLGQAERARACSESAPVRHTLAFTTAGLLAFAGPEGRLVSFAGAPAALREDQASRGQVAAFTNDGRSMIVVEEHFVDEDRGAACLATFVEVVHVDIATGTRTRIRRLRSGGASAVRISPDDRYALVMAQDFGGTPVVHLFDLGTRERVRVTRDEEAWFVDGAKILLRDDAYGLRVVNAADGSVVASAELDAPHALVPGARTGRLLLAREEVSGYGVDARVITTVVEATIDGRRLRLGRPLRRIPGRAVSLSADGTTLLVHARSAARVIELSSGRTLHSLRSSYRYSAMAMTPDARTLGVVTFRRPTRAELEDPYDPHAFLPTMIERFELPAGTRTAFGDLPASTLR